MVDYRVLVSDASTGTNLAELPLDNLTFSRQLSGCGQLSGSLSIWHPSAQEDYLGQSPFDPDREITVFRDDVPVWNGPLTGTSGSLSGDAIDITAREASWYLTKRTLEVDKDYTGEDPFDAVRDLESYMESKTATGDDGTLSSGDDIAAALPRFSVTSGDAGTTLGSVTFAGSARHTIQECFEFLAADPETGFEWRMDYRTASTRQQVHRTLTLGYPSLGDTLTVELTEGNLFDFSRDLDWERGATRVHVIGSGYTKTLQSSQAVDNGVILLETVADMTDTSNTDFIDSYAKDLRRLSRPAPRTFTAAFVPNDLGLAWGFCDLGDVVPFQIEAPNILSITANTRRVIQIDVSPPTGDSPELVTLTFSDPLSDLAA